MSDTDDHGCGGSLTQDWPGLVSSTSHAYRHSYFDDNYYIAFRRIPSRSAAAAAASSMSMNGNGGPLANHHTCDEEADSHPTSSMNIWNQDLDSTTCTTSKNVLKKFKFSAFSEENTVVIRKKIKPGSSTQLT